MGYITTKNGYCLTLHERKIMMLMLAESKERVKRREAVEVPAFYSQCTTNINIELQNVYLLLGDYVAAYQQGYINQSDIERCGHE